MMASLFASPECVAPIPCSPSGARPRISDGFAPAGDPERRNGVGHRGADWMYRRTLPALTRKALNHPWGSKWHYMEPFTPALAILPGRITRAGELSTGWHVIIDHGEQHGTGYHHLAMLLHGIVAGATVHAGQPLGLIGGSPIGYGLVHLHHDTAIRGKFVDPAPWARRWRILSYADAWGSVGRVAGEGSQLAAGA